MKTFLGVFAIYIDIERAATTFLIKWHCAGICHEVVLYYSLLLLWRHFRLAF